jgi:hypothetical protein
MPNTGNKLSIVVTCTSQKTSAPPPQLQARNLACTTTEDRCTQWRAALQSTAPSTQLRNLYRGAQWAQVQLLHQKATSVGWDVSLFVASAGLGLRSVESFAPSYAATFTPRQQDTVTSRHADNVSWWRALRTHTVQDELPSDTPVLLVLSEVYVAAMHDDIISLTESGRDVLLVSGGDVSHIPVPHVRVQRDLRTQLGGVVANLGPRVAAKLVEFTSCFAAVSVVGVKCFSIRAPHTDESFGWDHY